MGLGNLWNTVESAGFWLLLGGLGLVGRMGCKLRGWDGNGVAALGALLFSGEAQFSFCYLYEYVISDCAV